MSSGKFYNECDLLLQVSKGDKIAFRELFDRYRDKLYNYILTLSVSREFAEDTVHDVFLKIWLDREKLNGIRSMNAYLYRMAHNHALNALRRMASQTLLLAELERQPVNEVCDPGSQLIWKEASLFINHTIKNLTPQQKLILTMSREEGLRQEEIANRLNISILTVKKHLADARNVIRRELTANYGLHIASMSMVCFFAV